MPGETAKVDLGDGAWAEVKKKLQFGDWLDIYTILGVEPDQAPTPNQMLKGLPQILAVFVTAWSYSGPVDEAGVRGLDLEPTRLLLEAVKAHLPLVLRAGSITSSGKPSRAARRQRHRVTPSTS